MKKRKKNENKDPYSSINRRLDALTRILLETLYEKKKKFNEGVAVRTLHSAGLTPTEIAKILGKKGGATDVSVYLYQKSSKKKKSKKSEDVEDE